MGILLAHVCCGLRWGPKIGSLYYDGCEISGSTCTALGVCVFDNMSEGLNYSRNVLYCIVTGYNYNDVKC